MYGLRRGFKKIAYFPAGFKSNYQIMRHNRGRVEDHFIVTCLQPVINMVISRNIFEPLLNFCLKIYI